MVEFTRVEIVFSNVLKIMEVDEEPLVERGFQVLAVKYESFTITFQGDHAMYNLPIDHTVKMQVSYTDSAGNPAKVESVEWFPANAEIAAIEVDANDPTICKVMPVALGRTQVSAKADADLGEGVRELLTVCDIMIVAGEAVAGSIQPTGEQEPIPPQSASGGEIDNSLPGAQPGVDNSLPGAQPGIDNSLPGGAPARPDNTLPDSAAPKRR
jgi:hypothetical protein